MGAEDLDLSVVLPAYDEARRLPPTVRRVAEFLAGSGLRTELIVVDDGSADGTVAAVEALAAEGVPLRLLRHQRNRGKGAAVATGVMAATGATILFSDADLSTPIEEAHVLIRALEDADVAIGSRALDRGLIEVHQPLPRELMGRVFNVFVQAVLLRGLWDTQCGFKAFRRDAAHAVFGRLRSEGFDFDVEVLYRARRAGLRIVEVPVRWRNSADTRVSAVGDSGRMLRGLFRIRRMVDRGE
ncbi:MAG TPA: dolichyl-phosphate beta-glucosyltransferase [Candidatus Dormibacteraeota bacterium]|jgi:dolichyl-phosphate beta-glucosyltransferase|nr:dolichyl-phosphate beta-glucosyltransferase [Candidatus Dormibacteraeota bacterium]